MVKLLLFWLALATNRYSAEMDVIVIYPYAWADVSYVTDRPSWVVYSDYRFPNEYDCVLARSYKGEGQAWELAKKNMKHSLCRKGEYGE